MDLTKAVKRITDLADYYIPDDLKSDRDHHNQARVFLISHLFGPFIGSTVPLALYILSPKPSFDIAVLAVSILGFWIFPPLLKYTGAYRTLALISVQNLIFCILWSCYFYGGIASPTLPWVLIIPLLAFFYIGSSAFMRSAVIGMFVANGGVFLYMYGYYPPPGNGIPMTQIENLGIVSMVATSIYVAMMASYFAKVHESQAELEALVREHMATAAELREATTAAEYAGAAKAEFLAKMTHELRTPLNAIIGYSQMLREDAVEEGDQETISDLDRIHDAGVHLLRLINEILDLAKIDAGKMQIFEEETCIADVIRCAADLARPAAQQNGNVMNVQVDPAIGNVMIDQQKLEQILSQIIDNAVKFTKSGIVSIVAEIEPKGGADILRIAVSDTGCGISEADLAQLFEQFTVLGDSSSSKYGGTGLGLALSRKLSVLMGGHITVTSAVGKGSTFVAAFPVRRPETRTGSDADMEQAA
jgi:signal transduction histidine kinase